MEHKRAKSKIKIQNVLLDLSRVIAIEISPDFDMMHVRFDDSSMRSFNISEINYEETSPDIRGLIQRWLD